MTREELDRLRELASKATPGPWAWGKTYREIDNLQGKGGDYVLYMHTYEYEAGGNIEINKDNAAFIAGADPSVITALLDHIDRLEREAKAGRELRAAVYNDDEYCLQCVSSLATDAYDTVTKETGQ